MLSNVDYGMALVSTVVVSAVLMGGSGPFFSLGSITHQCNACRYSTKVESEEA
jgi:hypothetical protein